MDPVLRVISEDDWSDLLAVRLRALADAPDAFGATLPETKSLGEQDWRRRASGAGPVLLGFDAESPVAMGGLYAPDDSRDGFIWGMWVDPGWRGRGVGGRILQRLLDWAAAHDRSVSLHVTEGNDGARGLYKAHGFVSTGEWQPLRDGSDLRVETLRWTGGDTR